MRLPRWLLAAPEAPVSRRPTSPKGASGTVNQGGLLVPHEPNADVRGMKGLDVFDKMRRVDSTVKEALSHLFEPVKNAEWDFEPASDEPEDLEVAAFCRAAYFEHSVTSWHEHLSEALKFLVFGHYAFEVCFQVLDDELEYTDAEGEETAARRQFLTLRRFAARLPKTIYKWNVEEGELRSIVQWAFKDGAWVEVEIEATDLLLLVNEREGDDFTGQSILRPAYKPWAMKEVYERAGAIAATRYGAGIIIGYLPSSESQNSDSADRLEDILANLDAGEDNYIVVPWPKTMPGVDGATIEIVTPGASLPDLTSWAEFHRAEIKASVLARFAELGHAQVGARSTGDTQSTVWYNALNSVAKYICDAHNQGPVRRLVDANYKVARYPKLVASGIEVKNLTEFAQAVSQLVAGQAIIADPAFRNWVRDNIDAPEEAEAEEIVQDQQDRGGMTEQEKAESEAEQASQLAKAAPGKPSPTKE